MKMLGLKWKCSEEHHSLICKNLTMGAMTKKKPNMNLIDIEEQLESGA